MLSDEMKMADASGRDRPLLSIVVPCHNEEIIVAEAAHRFAALLRDLIAAGQIAPDSFLYFVDDGSADRTWAIISALHEQNPSVKALRLMHQAGHQNALLAGLLSLRERVDCAISIDCDMQQDESAIPSFLGKYRQGCDIVYGVRDSRRSDSYLKKMTALFFYRLMRLMGVKLLKNHADYRLVSRRVLRTLSEYREVNLFLRGIFIETGFKSEVVMFQARERLAGESKYSPARMLSFALDGITSFSIVPLRFVALAGAAIFIFSLLMTIWILFSVARGNVVPGWASTVIPIYFLGGAQVMLMGIIGEYVGKIYKEVKARPRYIVDTELF